MLIGKINKINTLAIEYNDIISEKDFRNLFPNTVFPLILTDEIINPFGYACIDTIEIFSLLQETSTLKMGCRAVFNDITKKYDREWILVPVTDIEKQDRINRKLIEVTTKRNELLIKSDYTQTLDNFFMKELWADYRQQLRDLPNSNIDPFLIVFPESPDIIKDDLDSRKKYMIEKIRENFNKLSSKNIVDTGLGYSVNGGYDDYLNFDMAKSMNVTQIRDSNTNKQTLNLGDIDIILNSIKTSGLLLMQDKWNKESQVNSCTTIAELALIVI